MDYTDQQIAEFKSEFSRRKRNQYIVAAPVIVAIFAVTFFEDRVARVFEGASTVIVGGTFAIAVVILIAFSRRNWRCPACDSYLGKSTSMKHCPSCGVTLN
jgi:rubrerythrin